MLHKLIAVLMFLLIIGCNSSPVEPLEGSIATIRFSIPKSGHVALFVENSYNTKVSTIIDRNMSAGSYRVQFDTENFVEGLYYFTLLFNDKMISRIKMVLVKP